MNLNNLNLKNFFKKYRQYISNERDLQDYIYNNQNLLTTEETQNLKRVNLLSYLAWGFMSLNIITIAPNSHYDSFIFWFLFLTYNVFIFYFFPKFKLFLNKNEYQSHIMKYALKSDVKFFFQQHEAIFYSALNEFINKQYILLLPAKKNQFQNLMSQWKEFGLTTSLTQDLLTFITTNNLQFYLYSYITKKSKSFDNVQKWFTEFDYMVKTRDENFKSTQINELNEPLITKQIQEEQIKDLNMYNNNQEKNQTKSSNFVKEYFNNKSDSKFSLLKFKKESKPDSN